jgi:hypothetical protein
MDRTEEIIGQFNPVSLLQTESVRLLNRVDTKYLFPFSKLQNILQDLLEGYFVLEINGVRQCQYNTVYFDTPDLLMYRTHHNGKQNRYKIRARRYVESDTHFFEIKFKNNKARTIKERTKCTDIEEIGLKSAQFLETKTPFLAQNLIPSLHVNYTRITLVSKSYSERLTLDLNLSFEQNGSKHAYPGVVIAELKQDKSAHSLAMEVLRKHRIENLSVSKYCLGIFHLYPNAKRNRFKMKFQQIAKMACETQATFNEQKNTNT